MIKEYSGPLGTFSYDSSDFMLSDDGHFLKYVGDGENVILPAGCISTTCMFSGWEGEVLDLSRFNTSGVENFSEMFSDCPNLVEIIGIENLDVSAGKQFSVMFCCARKLRNLDLSKWDMRNALDIAAMFWGCESLEVLKLSTWDLQSCTDISMFANGCQKLVCLDVGDWNIPHVTKATKFACSCTELRDLNMSSWNSEVLTNVDGMLANCPNLQTPDLSSLNLSDYAISRMYLNTADSEEMIIF